MWRKKYTIMPSFIKNMHWLYLPPIPLKNRVVALASTTIWRYFKTYASKCVFGWKCPNTVIRPQTPNFLKILESIHFQICLIDTLPASPHALPNDLSIKSYGKITTNHQSGPTVTGRLFLPQRGANWKGQKTQLPGIGFWRDLDYVLVDTLNFHYH